MPTVSQAQWQILPHSHGLKNDPSIRMGKNRNKCLQGRVQLAEQRSGEEWGVLGYSFYTIEFGT